MFNLGYLKRRLGQYAALWVGGFLVGGAAILIGLLFADLMTAVDRILPVMLGALALTLGAGTVMTLVSGETLGTKLAAAFQIGVSRVLFPIGQALGQGDLFGWLWTAFQWVSTVVGFLSALARVWPAIRRLLGPEPPVEA